MSNLGLGVILQNLFGNESSVNVFLKGVGKKIVALELSDEKLNFAFEDGYKMYLVDDGQSCCETRYMTTDDKLTDFVGSTLVSAEVREGPETQTEYGEPHETAFLVVTTSIGAFTCVTHNEHNGYYGGFAVRAHEG